MRDARDIPIAPGKLHLQFPKGKAEALWRNNDDRNKRLKERTGYLVKKEWGSQEAAWVGWCHATFTKNLSCLEDDLGCLDGCRTKKPVRINAAGRYITR